MQNSAKKKRMHKSRFYRISMLQTHGSLICGTSDHSGVCGHCYSKIRLNAA